ncbi:MAG: response regulator transcription factor [Pseudomonadota bacterium]
MNGHVQIVGSLRLQNELMARFLESEAGMTCVYCDNAHSNYNPTTEQKTLALYDALNMEPEQLWTEICTGSLLDPNHCFIALFNVNRCPGIENQAMKQGLRGIFFEHDPLDTLVKGIQAIFNGEIWFSRKTLTECLSDQRDLARPKQEAQTLLTPREKEILLMIASGATNSEVADKLCISPNTVKTHVYNIYRKTKSPNRMQAALWAAKNL